MKVEVTVPGFPSLIVLMVSVDVKQHLKKKKKKTATLTRTPSSDYSSALLRWSLKGRPEVEA